MRQRPVREAIRASAASLLALLSAACGSGEDVIPAGSDFVLKHAHAHNDYAHERPLYDALDHGFGSIEADVYVGVLGGELYVAHDRQDIDGERTLRGLYLDPLAARVAANGGSVYGDGAPVQLLVDFKSSAEATYRALEDMLAGYRDMLSCVDHGVLQIGAITVVVSGNRPHETMAAESTRCAFYDGRLEDLAGDDPVALTPLISADWGSSFGWKGEGAMPADEQAALIDAVRRTHAAGRKLRFWGTPDAAGAARTAIWDAELAAGVDYLNTDDLQGLEDYLRARGDR